MIAWLLWCLALGSPAFAQDEAPAAELPSTQEVAAREQQVVASLTLKVLHREEAAQALIDAAESEGGYFSSYTASGVVLRIPVASTEGFLQEATALGLVVQREYSSTDLGGALLDLRARLSGRNDVLAQFFEMVPTAGVKSIVTVEREIVNLVADIERIQGRIRYLEHQAAMSRIDIAFEFRERSAPSRDGDSSFAWLNTLNVADLVQDFRYDEWPFPPSNAFAVSPPEGFSAYKTRHEHRAVSPDEVLYRVRTEKHEPRADLAFWKEAVTVRMAEAGYTALRDQEITAGAAQGWFLEFTAPLGTQDYAYGVAAFPQGAKLVVVEAAGEVSRYEARRDQIVAAIDGLSL
jgi:hypothetical protein